MKRNVPSVFRIPRAARKQIIATMPHDRLDLFLTTANRFDTPIGNVEKAFGSGGCWFAYSKSRETGVDV